MYAPLNAMHPAKMSGLLSKEFNACVPPIEQPVVMIPFAYVPLFALALISKILGQSSSVM